MIINSITLHNFMSYADVNLDLTSVSVACFSGSNGAGKSALLDSITWALWEKARSSSDEMIRIGQSEMWVDLVFTYEERTYRIRRSRKRRMSKKGGRGQSKGTLDFQVLQDVQGGSSSTSSDLSNEKTINSEISQGNVATQVDLRVNKVVASKPQLQLNNGDFGHWKSLTGSTMRDTQRTITELLRMEYDTFINSAYLKQGRADEFTTRAPNERKQVLSEILGLSYFEKLKESCRLMARESKGKIEVLEDTVSELPDLEERMKVSEDELASCREELKQLETEKSDIETNLASKQKLFQDLNSNKQKGILLKEKINYLTSELGSAKKQHHNYSDRLNELNNLIENSSQIKNMTERFQKLRKETEELDQKSLSMQESSEKKHSLKSELAAMRSRLEVEVNHKTQMLNDIRAKIAKLTKETENREKLENEYQEYLKLIEEDSKLSSKQDSFTRLNNRMRELESTIVEEKIKLEAELDQKKSSLEEFSNIVKSKNSLDVERVDLESLAKDMDKYEVELELVEQKGLEAKSEIESLALRVQDFSRRKQENLDRINELHDHDHSSICPLCSAPIVDRSKVIGRYKSLNQSLDKEATDTKEEIELLEDKRAELRKEYKKLRVLLEGRKDLDKKIGQFNEKSASVDRAVQNAENLGKEVSVLEAKLKDCDYAQTDRESLIGIKSEIHKLEFDPVIHSNLQAQIRSKRHVESRYQHLKKDLNELTKIESELPTYETTLRELNDQLQSESYGKDLRQQLSQLNQDLDKLNYDREYHIKLKGELKELLPYQDQLNELAKAQDEKPKIEEDLKVLATTIEEKQKLIGQLETESEGLGKDQERLPEIEDEIKAISSRLDNLNSERDVSSRKVAVLESQVNENQKYLEKIQKKKETLIKLKEESEDYLVLAKAFGKKGIQAIIIENAIPEIELEANRILGRLTDNKMHIALVTQQKTKSGTISETLEILIGDEVGTRNYELYSGGEAFKVNFAVRLSLSRLLARRAGARLETLIIDEGFGSQDDKSRERLVRSIKAIQSDFSRILVITHVSDVREMFPTQIHVTKENGVSRLAVVS